MTGLTAQQSRCLQVIAALTHNGVPPSYDEIRVTLGLSSKSGVARLIDSLEQRGYLRTTYGHARSLSLTRPVSVDAPDKADLLAMSDEQLRFHLAMVCGVLAHRIGAANLRAMFDRIGARLSGARAA